jgi:sodium pump decarboxylase gamma subunit
MIYNVLSVAEETVKDYGGAFSGARFAEAGIMMLFGMIMVFAVLAILWGILALMKLIMVGKTPKAKKTEKSSAVAEVIEESAKASKEDPVIADVADDGELVAVITAAIAAYRASEGVCEEYTVGFRVVSFKRTNGGRAWNANK